MVIIQIYAPVWYFLLSLKIASLRLYVSFVAGLSSKCLVFLQLDTRVAQLDNANRCFYKEKIILQINAKRSSLAKPVGYKNITLFCVHNLSLPHVLGKPETRVRDFNLKFFLLKKKSISFNGKRYEVTLSSKYFLPTLLSNYDLSYDRLKSILRTLQSKPELFKQYHQIIQNQ